MTEVKFQTRETVKGGEKIDEAESETYREGQDSKIKKTLTEAVLIAFTRG
jgi:hypothetical protein